MYRPKRFSERELDKAGVELVDLWHGILRCKCCGNGWAINNPPAGQRLPRGYWQCPYYRCNCDD